MFVFLSVWPILLPQSVKIFLIVVILGYPAHQPSRDRRAEPQRAPPERVMMEDKRKKRSPKVSLPQPPPPPINPRKLSVLPASKSATFSLGLPQPPSPKNRGKYKRSIGAPGQPKEVFTAVVAPPKTTRFVIEPKM